MSFFLSAKGYEYLDPKVKGQAPFDDEAFLLWYESSPTSIKRPSEESLGRRVSERNPRHGPARR